MKQFFNSIKNTNMDILDKIKIHNRQNNHNKRNRHSTSSLNSKSKLNDDDDILVFEPITPSDHYNYLMREVNYNITITTLENKIKCLEEKYDTVKKENENLTTQLNNYKYYINKYMNKYKDIKKKYLEMLHDMNNINSCDNIHNVKSDSINTSINCSDQNIMSQYEYDNSYNDYNDYNDYSGYNGYNNYNNKFQYGAVDILQENNIIKQCDTDVDIYFINNNTISDILNS